METALVPAGQQRPAQALLAVADVSVPFNRDGEIRRPALNNLITNAQLLALEQRPNGNLRLELQVNNILLQAASGFPGAVPMTEYIGIAESRWRQRLAGLGSTLGMEMLIPFPDDDEPRRAVAGFLREAQRLLSGPRDRRFHASGVQGAEDHQELRQLELARQEGQGRNHAW